MKNFRTIVAAVAVLWAVSCGRNVKTGEVDMKNTENLKEVAGRVNFGAQHPVMTPQPCIMIATYDADQVPDVMMAAWGGQCDYNRISFELSSHKTTDNLRLKKAFTVSFATENDVDQSDYFGLVSGNSVPDKVARAGFTATPSPNVDAPIINEYLLTLECRVVTIDEDGEGGAHVVGEVVNWSADESVLTDGKVDLAKLKPIVFDSAAMTYRSVGENVGNAWQSGKRFK